MSFEPLDQGSPSKVLQPRSPILNKFTPSAKPVGENAFLTEVPIQEPLTFPKLYDQNLTDSRHLLYKYSNLNKPYKEPKQYGNQVRIPQTKEPVNIIQKKSINSRLFANKFFETLPVVNTPPSPNRGNTGSLMNAVLTPNGIREVSYKEHDSQLLAQASDKSPLLRIALRKEVHPSNAMSFLKEQLERESKLSPTLLKNLSPSSQQNRSPRKSGSASSSRSVPKPLEKKVTTLENPIEKKETTTQNEATDKKNVQKPEIKEPEEKLEDLEDPLEMESNQPDENSENGDIDDEEEEEQEVQYSPRGKTNRKNNNDDISQTGNNFESERFLRVENNLMQEKKAREGVEQALFDLAKQQQTLIKKLVETTRKKSALSKQPSQKSGKDKLDKKQLRSIIADVMSGLEVSGNVSNNRTIKRLVNTLKAKHPELSDIISADNGDIPEGPVKKQTYRTGFTQGFFFSFF